jgi:hypothetical protein
MTSSAASIISGVMSDFGRPRRLPAASLFVRCADT